MPDVAEEIVEAAPAEGETSSESASEGQQEPQEGEPKPKGGFQKRIDRLTKTNTQLEQEKEYWRQEALRTAKPPVATTKDTPAGKPSENDFSTHAEFLEALTDWKVDQRLKAAETSKNAEKVKETQQTAAQQFKGRQEAFREATPDFDEVLDEGAEQIGNLSAVFIGEIVESEHGPELQYYFAKNPEEAKRINSLPPLAMARAMGRLESRFTTSPVTKTAKTTAAPAPPNPTGKSSATSTKDPGDMTPAEYKAWRAKQ